MPKQTLTATAAALLFMLAGTAAGQTQEQKKADKTQPPQDVRVTNVVPTHPGVPPGAFSVVFNGGLVSGPDPEGTVYAITSLTVANITSLPVQVSLEAVYGTTSDCISFPSGVFGANGPVVRVPVGETVHLSFPQPFILAARPGAATCLRTNAAGAPIFTVVGYRLPPAEQPAP